MPDPEFCLPRWTQGGMCIQLLQSRRIALPLLDQNPRRYIISQTGTVNFDTTRSRVGMHSRLAFLPLLLLRSRVKNARAMAEAGAAIIPPERDLSADSLATAILRIFGVGAVRKKMQSAAVEIAAPDAAKKLAEHVLSLAS